MDTTKAITHIGLCAGYGGIELGLKRCIGGLRTVAYAEIETSAIELLLARMEGGSLDPAPIWTDLRSFPWSAFSDRVDILSGGYPCQPFSSAGKRLGADDPRHLWPAIASGIRLLRPRLCCFENVEGHITLGLSTVVSDLEELGYSVSWGLFSAAECGAPHQRKRVFIVAKRIGEGLERYAWHGAGIDRQGWLAPEQDGSTGASGVCAWPSRPGEPQHAWEPPRVVGNAEQQHDGGAVRANELQSGTGRLWPCRKSFTQTDRKSGQTQPSLGGDTDGPAGGLDYGQLCHSSDNRTDELRMLGNGVVPATAERAFRVLLNELYERS